MRYRILTLLVVFLAHYAWSEIFTVTAYCPCKKCCGRWSGGPTASGIMPAEKITVSGPRRFRFGAWVEIEGIGKRQIQDRLAKRFDNRFEIYFQNHEEAKKFGKQKLNVTILK